MSSNLKPSAQPNPRVFGILDTGITLEVEVGPLKDYWEMTVAELDEQICTTQAILDAGGYNKRVADHLAMLQEEREERLIEEEIIGRSSYAQTVMGLAHKPLPD